VTEQTPESTGHPVVDEVIASLTALDGLPVEQHAAVFEAVHDRLRGVLADAGDNGADI
jgi:hypothetical protein